MLEAWPRLSPARLEGEASPSVITCLVGKRRTRRGRRLLLSDLTPVSRVMLGHDGILRLRNASLGSSVMNGDSSKADEYLAHVNDLRSWYDRVALIAGRSYRRMRMVALVAGSAVPVASATTAPRWVLAALGSLAVVVDGYQQPTGNRDRSIVYMSARQSVSRELHLYQARAGDYTNDNSYQRFIERIEQIEADTTNRILSIRSQDQAPNRSTND